jgi:hypothetical protein
MNNTIVMELELSQLRMQRNKRENELLLDMARTGWNQYFQDIIQDNWSTDEELLKGGE